MRHLQLKNFLCRVLYDGGVGINANVLNNKIGIPLGILTVVLNVPFLLVGAKKMGKRFISQGGLCYGYLSVFLEVFAPMVNATRNYLLAVSFGGVILGIGVGLVIRFGGCLDGTETVAILLNKRFKELPL